MEQFENYTPRMAYDWLRRNQANDSERDYLEGIIATSADDSYLYALLALRKPFPLGEPIIATDAYFSYYYALNVLEKPFPMGEPIIATNVQFSYLYAKNVLEKPFPLGEEAIFKDKKYARLYRINVLHDFSDIETNPQEILEDNTFSDINVNIYAAKKLLGKI